MNDFISSNMEKFHLMPKYALLEEDNNYMKPLKSFNSATDQSPNTCYTENQIPDTSASLIIDQTTRQLIVSCHPTANGCEQFWEMIVENQIENIIMLHLGNHNTEYFPKPGQSIQCGRYKIQSIFFFPKKRFQVCDNHLFRVTDNRSSETRDVVHHTFDGFSKNQVCDINTLQTVAALI